MAEYKVMIGCRSDKTGKSFEPGDVIAEKEFPAPVIENWLEIGVLEHVGPPGKLDITKSAWELAESEGIVENVRGLDGEGSGADGRILVADVEELLEDLLNGEALDG